MVKNRVLKCVSVYTHTNIEISIYSGTSLIRSPAGLGKSDLIGEVTLLQGTNLHCIMQYGTEQG